MLALEEVSGLVAVRLRTCRRQPITYYLAKIRELTAEALFEAPFLKALRLHVRGILLTDLGRRCAAIQFTMV